MRLTRRNLFGVLVGAVTAPFVAKGLPARLVAYAAPQCPRVTTFRGVPLVFDETCPTERVYLMSGGMCWDPSNGVGSIAAWEKATGKVLGVVHGGS